jgi:hypothetical protein
MMDGTICDTKTLLITFIHSMKSVSIIFLISFWFCTVFAQIPNENHDLSLIGHYLLEGNSQDHSGYGHHAIALGDYTSDRNGVPQSALRLSENGHYIHFPDIITLSEPEWTYSLWVMPERLATSVSDMFLLSNADVSEWEDIPLFIDDSDNEIKIWYASDAWKYSTGVVTEVGKWYHVAISSTADDTIRIYVNGIKRLERKIDLTSVGNNSFMLGSVIDFPEAPLKGRLYGVVDDVRIYSRAIQDEEVATIYNPLWNYVPEPDFITLTPTLLNPNQPLQVSSNSDLIDVRIFDAQGKMIFQTKPVNTTEISILLGPLSGGMYFVHAYSTSARLREKVIILR